MLSVDKISQYRRGVEAFLLQIHILWEVRTWVKLVCKTIKWKNNRPVIDFSTIIPCKGRTVIYHLCLENPNPSLSLSVSIFHLVRFLEAPLSVFVSRGLCDSPFSTCWYLAQGCTNHGYEVAVTKNPFFLWDLILVGPQLVTSFISPF